MNMFATFTKSLVLLVTVAFVCIPVPMDGQTLLRGKFVVPPIKTFACASVKSMDFVTYSTIDSVGVSNDGSFALPIKQHGVNRILFALDSTHEIQAPLYFEHSIEIQVLFPKDDSTKPRLNFPDVSSRTAKLFEIYDHVASYAAKFRAATRGRQMRPGTPNKKAFDWDPYVADLNRQISTEPDPIISEALMIARLPAFFCGDTLSPQSARLILNAISPRHPFWPEFPSVLVVVAVHANLLDYLDSVALTHPDSWARAATMFYYLPQGQSARDSIRVRRYATRLLSEFPNSTLTKMATPFATISTQNWSKGTPMPSFTFVDLRHSTSLISSSQFHGRVYLIAFWATWCAHCVEQFPFLRAAYERYRQRGFEILSVSVDDTPEKAGSFLQARPPMPWRQAYANGAFNNPDVKRLGVFAVPTEYLVDERGRVLATTPDLTGSELDSTLARIWRK